ncbi:primase 2 [Trypanosoma vivax]|nr:primase 2 [Trypanosoma vivax]
MDPATAVRERRRRKGKDAVLEGVQLPSNERLPAGPALRQLTQQATRETRMGPAVAPFPHLKEPQVAVPGSRLEVAKAKGKKEPLSKTEKAEVPVRAEARGEQVPASKSVISAAAERAPSSPTVVSSTSTSKVNDAATTAAALSNPFRGLHEHISRSYRLDQLQAVMQPNDLLLGRQESKTGAFSFIRFACGQDFLNDHRASGFPSLHSPTNPDGGAAKSNSGRKGSKKKDASENDCLLVVAERLLAFPQNMRNFHTVCGRENVPCDFFADIDLPNETQASGEKILLEVLNYLDVRLQGIGFMRPSFIILTNEVPSADKVSYHVHARAMGKSGEEDESDAFGSVKQNGLNGDHDSKKSKANKPTGKTIAFQDYRVVKLLADEVNLALGRTIIDEQCYRNNGMLRCAFSTKINAPGFSPLSTPPSDATGAVGQQKGKRLVPLRKAKDPALQKRLDEMSIHLGELSDAQILERTFCIRTAPVSGRLLSSSEDGVVQKISTDKKDEYLRSFKLIRARHILGPQSKQAVEYDAYGNVVSVYLTEAAKWRRFKTVVEKLRRLPPRSAESYDIWVRVGLALHNFSNEDHVFEEWVRFSLKCPQKYSRESCRRKWQQFERNPDALNWRRGFNYLNSTIWRSVHGLY